MPSFKKSLFIAGLLALSAAPAQAFFDGMVAGMTSVTNNLIDSSENVTITSINTTSTTILLLSNDIGKMADRINVMADKIGVMADRIGVMADRIVLTESMMANFAHKVEDNKHQLAMQRHAASNDVRQDAPAVRAQYVTNSAYPAYTAYPAYQPAQAGNPYLAKPNPVVQAPVSAQCVRDWRTAFNASSQNGC